MKKFLILAALLAVTVALAISALVSAQVDFANAQEAQSGDFSADFSVSNEGFLPLRSGSVVPADSRGTPTKIDQGSLLGLLRHPLQRPS